MPSQQTQTQIATKNQKKEQNEFDKSIVAAGERSADHKTQTQQQTGIYRQFMTLQKQVAGAEKYDAAGEELTALTKTDGEIKGSINFADLSSTVDN